MTQSLRQQGGGVCVEVGQFGFEGDIERLKRDRNVLMTEIVRLRQQQHNSKEQVISMEGRLQATEKKQQRLMTFLAKALTNPTFFQQLVQKNNEGINLQGVEIGRKRRLTTSTSVEDLQEEVTVDVDSDQLVDFSTTYEQQEELVSMESEIETFFSVVMDNESSSDIKNHGSGSMSTRSSGNLGSANELIWEELLNEDLITGNPDEEVMVGGEQSELDLEVEDVVAKQDEWVEDLQNLVDQLGFSQVNALSNFDDIIDL